MVLLKSGLKQSSYVASVLAACLLIGCASQGQHQVSHSSQQKVIKNSRGVPNLYQVKSGDTVAKIAKHYGLDWREVARLNKLDGSYTIYTGQWLRLWAGNGHDVKAFNQQLKASAYTQPPRTVYAPPPPPQPKISPVATYPSTPVPVNQAPTLPQVYQNPAPAAPTIPMPAPAPRTTPAPFATGSVGVMQFQYPVGTSNPVVRRFGAVKVKGETVTSNGMWFSGRDGDVIAASHAGTVIHADDNAFQEPTISIQHNNGFISSYIYIKDAKVKSGDTVQAGQPIARMRQQAGSAAIFEFRIMRNNVYIDPLTVLK